MSSIILLISFSLGRMAIARKTLLLLRIIPTIIMIEQFCRSKILSWLSDQFIRLIALF